MTLRHTQIVLLTFLLMVAAGLGTDAVIAFEKDWVPTLSGWVNDTAAEAFSLRILNTWALGNKGIDDGILVTLAMKERRARIELGKGMERFISDADAKAVLDTEMLPLFAKHDFSGGLELGLKRLMEEGRRFVVEIDSARLN